MTIIIGAREARQKFADLLGKVGYAKEVAIVQRSGKSMAAFIPMDMYEQLIAEREARFQVLDRVRKKLPVISVDEIAQDVEQAIEAVRDEDAAAGS